MFRYLPFAVLIFVASCQGVPPAEPQHVVHVPACPWTDIEQEKAIDMFISAFGGADTLKDFQIRCDNELPLDKNLTGGVPASGVTLVDKHLIVLSSVNELTIGRSAFFHELLHAYLWKTTGDADNNHSLPGGPWSKEMSIKVGELKVENDPNACKGGDVYFDNFTCLEYLMSK